jgi:hypothetical protein
VIQVIEGAGILLQKHRCRSSTAATKAAVPALRQEFSGTHGGGLGHSFMAVVAAPVNGFEAVRR